jgi:hypothetical protein
MEDVITCRCTVAGTFGDAVTVDPFERQLDASLDR